MNNDEKKVLQKSQKLNNWNNQKLYYSIGKENYKKWTVKRNEVYFVDLGENIGSEENKIRPVVVLQSNAYNFSSPIFICAVISNSSLTIPDIQVPISGTYFYNNAGEQTKLTGTIDLGQIKTLAKERIISHKICTLSNEVQDINNKILNIFGLSKLLERKNNIIVSLKEKCEYLKNFKKFK